LCEQCAEQLPLLSDAVCPQCGRPQADGMLCQACHAEATAIIVRSAFVYEEPVRGLIHSLKYRGATSLAAPLGRRMADAWSKLHLQTDVLIPVPLHPRRELRRGYNQSLLLAQSMGLAIQIAVTGDTLRRSRDTASQTHLNRAERRHNVENAFLCDNDRMIRGKRVTLVDDVATTGATLEACAGVLREQGVLSVDAFTLARAP